MKRCTVTLQGDELFGPPVVFEGERLTAIGMGVGQEVRRRMDATAPGAILTFTVTVVASEVPDV